MNKKKISIIAIISLILILLTLNALNTGIIKSEDYSEQIAEKSMQLSTTALASSSYQQFQDVFIKKGTQIYSLEEFDVGVWRLKPDAKGQILDVTIKWQLQVIKDSSIWCCVYNEYMGKMYVPKTAISDKLANFVDWKSTTKNLTRYVKDDKIGFRTDVYYGEDLGDLTKGTKVTVYKTGFYNGIEYAYIHVNGEKFGYVKTNQLTTEAPTSGEAGGSSNSGGGSSSGGSSSNNGGGSSSGSYQQFQDVYIKKGAVMYPANGFDVGSWTPKPGGPIQRANRVIKGQLQVIKDDSIWCRVYNESYGGYLYVSKTTISDKIAGFVNWENTTKNLTRYVKYNKISFRTDLYSPYGEDLGDLTKGTKVTVYKTGVYEANGTEYAYIHVNGQKFGYVQTNQLTTDVPISGEAGGGSSNSEGGSSSGGGSSNSGGGSSSGGSSSDSGGGNSSGGGSSSNSDIPGDLISDAPGNLLDSQEGRTLLEVIIKQIIEGEISLEMLEDTPWILCIQRGGHVPAENYLTSEVSDDPDGDATVVSGTIEELMTQVEEGDVLGEITIPGATSYSPHPYENAMSRTIAIYQVKEQRELTPEEAYILAHLEELGGGGYYNPVQVALWIAGYGTYEGSEFPDGKVTPEAEGLAEEAAGLAKALEEINAFKASNNGKSIVATYDNCTVSYSRETQEFLIGPFTLDYVRAFHSVSGYESIIAELDGISPSTVDYSGITQMVLKTDQTQIKLDKSNFIYTKDRKNQDVDGEYQFPQPGEEFYITFVQDSPIDSVPKRVTGLDIQLQELNAEGTAYELTGVYKEVEWEPKKEELIEEVDCKPTCPDTHTGTHEEHYGCKYWIEATYVSEPIQAQNMMLLDYARIFALTHEENISLNLKLTIDLSGTVWNDEHSGKQSDYNGQMDDGEKGIKGVKVSAIAENKEIAYTYTDENGKYQIKDLPVGKYDIQFEYDGQTYESTSLLATGDETAGNVEEYIKDANNEKYFNTSKAQETEQDRINFNNKFYEIAEGVAIGKDGTKNELNTYKTENRVTELITRDPETNIPYNLYKITSRTSSDNMWYPLHDNFHIEDYNKTINGKTYIAIYPYMEHVNLGLIERAKADIAIKKDVLDATVTINEKKLVYGYNARAGLDSFDVNLKQQPEYSDIYYNREVYESDYNYRIDDYKNNKLNISGDEIHGLKVIDNELKVFVTYKITIANQSQIHKATINELVDYFDSTYNLIKEDYYLDIQDNQGVKSKTLVAKQSYYEKSNGETGKIEWTDTSKVNTKKYDGYTTIYTDDLTNIMLESGERLNVYLTFEVQKDSNRGILLGEKENVVEINNYSTFDLNATNKENAEGRIDSDSAPGNVKIGDISTYEDDTDNAPVINIKLHTETQRYIDGYVWDDERTEKLATGQEVGDGVRQNGEELVNGVTVQLVELIKTPDGRQLEYIWREMQTGENVFKYVDSQGSVQSGTRGTIIENAQIGNIEKGQYKFFSYIPGNYIVRFKYGDTTKTVQTAGVQNGANEISYNGQDYKSTAYQTGMNLGAEWYDLGAENLNGENVKISDARDNELRRLQTIKYSETLKNEKAMILAAPYRTPENQDAINQLINNTWMYADTAKIKVDVEYNTTQTNGMATYIYNIKSIDLGLEERPKTSIHLDKEIIGVRLTLADGTIIIDTANGLKDNVNIVKNKTRYDRKGMYTIYFDIEEIGNGATIQIDYKLTVTNKGEVDTMLNIPQNLDGITNTANVGQYLGTTYYTGKEDSNVKVVTTTVDKVLDYVDNNLVFRAENNQGWSIVSKDQLATEGLIDAGVQESIDINKHKQIVQTQQLAQQLTPGQSTQVNLTLTKVITGENEEDDLTYDNIAEIVQITNQVGRRDSLEEVKEGYIGAIPGNQNPYNTPQEHDTDFAEQVIITNSYGENRIYYVLIAAIAIILIAGIVVIKKVLPNKKTNN